MNSESEARRLSRAFPPGEAAIVVAVLAIAAYLAFTPALLNDGDTSWHLAAGRYIIETGAVPHQDPFSFTFRGQPWTAHEWLAEVVMAGVFNLTNWGGLALLFSLAVAATLLMIGRELRRRLALRYLLLLLVGLFVVLAPNTLARPHVLAWPLLAGWTLLLVHARERRRAPPVAWAAQMLVWANLHASFIIGLGLAGVFTLEALLEERNPSRTVRNWAPFVVASAAAAFVTPHGLQGLLYPFQVSGLAVLPLISEWRPTRLPDDFAFVIVGAVLALVTAMRWRRVGVVRLLLLAGLGWMAIDHSRHQALFAIVGSLAVLQRAFPVGERETESGNRPIFAVLVIAVLTLAAARLAIPYQRGDSRTYPVSALAALPPVLKSRPVLNSYSFGGPLILHGIAPYIDGRADMYGDAFTLEHDRMIQGDIAAFRSAADRWHLRWTILQTGTPLIARLDREPGWRRIYADRWAVVHVRIS